MTTNPYVLHATAALWSLAQAWPLLLSARQHALAAATDRSYIQAWRPTAGRMGSAGGVFDEALFAAANNDTDGGTRWYYERLYQDGLWSLQQGRFLLASAGLRQPATWAEYAGQIGRCDWRTAMDIKLWLASTDQVIRKALQLTPDLWTLPANPPCPSCGVRLMRVQRSAPDSAAWTVVCTAGCRCRGDGCPCGMLERVQGVGHIWDRTAAFLAPRLEGAAA